jgi:hypothetical protein
VRQRKQQPQAPEIGAPAVGCVSVDTALLLLLVPAAFGWDSCQKKNWYKTIQSKLDDIKVRSTTALHTWLCRCTTQQHHTAMDVLCTATSLTNSSVLYIKTYWFFITSGYLFDFVTDGTVLVTPKPCVAANQ